MEFYTCSTVISKEKQTKDISNGIKMNKGCYSQTCKRSIQGVYEKESELSRKVMGSINNGKKKNW